MKIFVRVVGALVVLLLVLYVAQFVAAESGEVVVLTTTNADGESQETRLWIVDDAESQWLRSGGEIQSWYANIKRQPEVLVERESIAVEYLAVPVSEKQDHIGKLMADKYGWADDFIGFLFGRDDSIPIRLDPR